ncbi:MAG: hypothetical protein R3268_07320 [Acidiferrobacterales bacterium]|nr:hypothetical protein [Acidiferrobacterales bacterium]
MSWLNQQERGSKVLIWLITWVALRMGRGVARLFLYPICFYFLALSRHARHASRQYLRRALQRNVGIKDVFHHYHCFASTILDRVFLLTNQRELFDIQIHGAELVLEQIEKGRGCILLGAHLGSFEVMRNAAIADSQMPIKVLMYEDNARKVMELARHLNPAVVDTIIPVGSLESMLQAKAHLDQGGPVGLLGDRLMKHDRVVPCTFLGGQAVFPAGPMLLAATTSVPVVLCFGLYRGGNRYDIHCELLAERIEVSSPRRSEELRHWTQRYADRLEHYCRLAPYNWFNFYDFWASPTR